MMMIVKIIKEPTKQKDMKKNKKKKVNNSLINLLYNI